MRAPGQTIGSWMSATRGSRAFISSGLSREMALLLARDFHIKQWIYFYISVEWSSRSCRLLCWFSTYIVLIKTWWQLPIRTDTPSDVDFKAGRRNLIIVCSDSESKTHLSDSPECQFGTLIVSDVGQLLATLTGYLTSDNGIFNFFLKNKT